MAVFVVVVVDNVVLDVDIVVLVDMDEKLAIA